MKEDTAISEQEVEEIQKRWGEGIVRIGKVFSEDGDYRSEALEHIQNFYGYEMGSVLFKPTMAYQKPFRLNIEGALSYFAGGDENYPEDHGFAIKPWISVRWESAGIKISGSTALSMGNYYFTPAGGGAEVKAEYSFAFTKDSSGRIRILLHDSHIPYSPN